MSTQFPVLRLTAPLLAGCGAAMLLGCAAPPQTTALAMQPLLRTQHSGDQSAAAWYRLGKYHQERGQVGLAMGAYAQSLALDGRQLDARMAVAAIDARQGRLAEARDALLALVDDYPAQAQLSNNLGYVYHLMGDQQAAIAMLRRALALDAASSRARDNLQLAQAAAAAGSASVQLAAAPPPAVPAIRGQGPASATAAPMLVATAATAAMATPGALASTVTALPAAPAAVAPDAGLPPPTRAELHAVQEQLRQLQLRHAATEAAVAAAALARQPAVITAGVAALAVPASEPAAKATGPTTAPATAPAPAAAAAAAPAAVRAMPLPAWPTPSAPALVQVEIANGNGAPGLAKRFRRALAQLGIPVGRLSNDKPYRQQQTVIEYRPGYRQQAAELQAALRGQATLQDAGTRSRTELRLVLGKDAPAQLARAEGATGAATLLAALGAGGSGNGNGNGSGSGNSNND